MAETRKITVEVPARLLARAQKETGQGVTETVREGLKRVAAVSAQRRLLSLRGQVDLGLTVEGVRRDRT